MLKELPIWKALFVWGPYNLHHRVHFGVHLGVHEGPRGYLGSYDGTSISKKYLPVVNPFKPDVWKSIKKRHETLCFKSYFETHKSYDHMQKIRPISQKFNVISRIKNCCNLLIFNFGLSLLFRCCINYV